MRLLAALLVLALTSWPVHAAELSAPQPVQKDGSFSALKKEYDEASKMYLEQLRKEALAQQEAALARLKAAERELQDAKTDAEKAAAQKKVNEAKHMPAMKMFGPADGPGATFAPRFLEFAEKNSKDPAALDSLALALHTSGGPHNKNGIWSRVVKNLAANHASSPHIKQLFQELARPCDEAANELLRQVIAQNPNRKVQAQACKALADGLAEAVKRAMLLTSNAEFRKNVEAVSGKAYVEKLLVHADKNQKEAQELAATLRAKYDDVFPDLSIGKRAPELLSQDVDGRPVKLSALKGKVVVLDIWATWCGPCKAMIPHEREMVERLKGKPFALVSISCDADKETLTAFLAKEKMPWTQWWNGAAGGILEDWDVHYFPTIYVLDAKGVIRFKDLRGEKLEEAVNQLLKELELNPSN
jgi:thiol-disulfide isomerase/thioredoxin